LCNVNHEMRQGQEKTRSRIYRVLLITLRISMDFGMGIYLFRKGLCQRSQMHGYECSRGAEDPALRGSVREGSVVTCFSSGVLECWSAGRKGYENSPVGSKEKTASSKITIHSEVFCSLFLQYSNTPILLQNHRYINKLLSGATQSRTLPAKAGSLTRPGFFTPGPARFWLSFPKGTLLPSQLH